MAAGPAIMAIGLLWFLRLPADSEAWVFGSGSGASIVPPADYFVDLLPALLVFGAGLMIMVAPLTTALMTSVPERNAGVASAINNSISRVGSPLVTAVIFVAVASSFYASIARQVPAADVDSRAFRADVAPLNQPSDSVPADVRAAARSASTDAFRLAMLVSAGLLLVGSAINGVGIRNPGEEGRHRGPGGEQQPSDAASASGPVRVSAEGFGERARPRREPTGPAREA
jgi:hypothetical protein